MKKVTRILTLVIAIFASINAWGRISPGERVTDYSLLKTGDRIFVEGKWGPNNVDLEAGHWLSTYFPARRADSIIVAVQETVGSQAAFELEESGNIYTMKYADGTTEDLKGFYVKSVKSGLYLTKGQEQGVTYTCDLLLTENKTTEWYICKAVTMGQNPDDPDGDRINIAPENAAFFACLAGDGTVLRLNNNYKDASSTYFCDKVAYFNNSTVWHEITYASEEDNSLEAVLLDIDELYTLAYTMSQTLVVGTNPGFCDENYYNALDVAMANSQDDSQLTTAEAAQTCYDNLLNAYLDISEKGVVPIRDGYYWFVNCQNDWNALQEGGTQVALSAQGKEVWWNTINKDKAEYIWKIALLPDGKYAMQNLGTQQFVDYGSGTTPVYTSADSSKNNVEFIALATAGSWGIKAYNPTPDGDDSYIHCRNHSLDPATGASTCLWLPRPQEFSGWYLLQVPQDIVDKLAPKDDEVEKQKLARALVDSLNNLISDVKAMITPSLEYDRSNATSVIPTLEAAQANNFADFFSNAGMSVEHGYSYGNDGGGFAALIDNDPETHFHTTYGTQPSWSDYTDTGTGYGYPTTKHNLGCKLTQPVNNVFFVWYERTGSYHDTPLKIDLEVSNDGENWTNVSYGYNLYTASGQNGAEVLVGPFEFNDNYQYVRFATEGSARGKFFNLSGMDILTGVTYASSCQLSAVEPATRIALFSALSNGNKQAENDSVSNIENLKAAIAQLTDAYNAFISTFVDVKDLKLVITRAKNALDGVVITENTVGTYDTSANPDAVASAVEEAESLIANVGYTQDEVDALTKKIDDALSELYTHIIAPDPNKWYQIQFASEEEYTEFKFDSDAEALIDRVVCVTQGQDETTKAPKPYDSAEDVIYGSAWLQSVPAENAWDVPELTYFRFISVGDSGYVIQNKATGLFVPDLGTSVKTNLSTVPGVFSVEWFGHGFVTLHTHNLFDGKANNNNFHFGNSSDYSQYYIVGWNSGMSTKSAFHLVTIDEEETIGNVNMTGTRALTIPETLKLEGGANAYTAKGKVIEEDGTTYIAMERTEEVPAGMPAIIVPEDAETAYLVSLGTDFVSKEVSTVGVKGTFVAQTMPDGSALLRSAEDKSLYWQPLSTVGMNSTANGIYLDVANIGQMPDVAKDEADLLILVKDYNSTVSVDKVKANVSSKHEIYTVDGVKLDTKPENLKKGLYIIDGKKVYVP